MRKNGMVSASARSAVSSDAMNTVRRLAARARSASSNGSKPAGIEDSVSDRCALMIC
ncbi:MAG: hypothetical protein IPN50_04400 [Sphingomonadales bacterium]|nr:hypothetical protein [Sphingomonadales bacterium]